MYKSQLSDYELKEFIRIHKEFLPIRNKHYNITSFEFPRQKINKIKKKDILNPILKKVYEILDFNKFNYDKNKYYVEFHQRNCGFEKKAHNLFEWHKDDYGAVSYKVFSTLFYIRKDCSVKGGNLLYKEDGKQMEHIVRSGNILSFKGDLIHFPQESKGFGCRDLIVVFVKRN